MIPIVDYHMHTPLCGHARGQLREYAQCAIDLGLKEIGFSDHAPLVCHEDPSITMSVDELPKYHEMVEDIQAEFKNQLSIRIGIEADFIPGYEDKTKAILEGYPYDYVIGSVHFIQDWAFDNPKQIHVWKVANTDEVYMQYHDYLRQSAESGMFDIMAHVDLVKKFGHRPKTDLTNEIEKTAEVFKDTGMVIEINTSGLRKPVKEIYPSLDVLSIYSKVGVPLIFGSDAHRPEEVGRDFDKAVSLAKAAGYTEYVLFKKRKIEQRVKINY